MRTAVLVSGSRDWMGVDVVYRRLKQHPSGTILIHGDARGLDKIAGTVGQELGFIVHRFPYFSDLGSAGGPVRNNCMFDQLLNFQRYGFDCHFEAFPLPSGRGTQQLVDHVRRHNLRADKPIPLWVYGEAA